MKYTLLLLLLLFYFTTFVIILTSLHIWVHSYKGLWKCCLKAAPTPQLAIYEQKKVGYIQGKNAIIGAGGTFAAIALFFLFLIPSIIARQYLVKNPEAINFGAGRAWTYINRMTMPILSFVILPFAMIGSNPKMRKVLIRELKDQIGSVNFT